MGNLYSPDIWYQYVVSRTEGRTPTYQWKLQDQWTACNRLCQGLFFFVSNDIFIAFIIFFISLQVSNFGNRSAFKCKVLQAVESRRCRKSIAPTYLSHRPRLNLVTLSAFSGIFSYEIRSLTKENRPTSFFKKKNGIAFFI